MIDKKSYLVRTNLDFGTLGDGVTIIYYVPHFKCFGETNESKNKTKIKLSSSKRNGARKSDSWLIEPSKTMCHVTTYLIR